MSISKEEDDFSYFKHRSIKWVFEGLNPLTKALTIQPLDIIFISECK